MESEQLSMFDDKQNKKNSDDKKIIKKQIEDLRKQIEYHNKMYYEEDNPVISDFEYDKLTQKLKKLEAQNPEFVDKNSPTQKVGGKTKNIFSEVTHDVQMQSLQDVFTYEDVIEFVNKIKQEYGQDTQFTVETKIDGLSVSLEYIGGVFTRGSTRGDGFIGEDVTQNLMQIKTIPHKLNSSDTIEVRGEVYLPRKEFEKINESLEQRGKIPLANPRNAAAGTLRQLNSELVYDRNLSIFIFNVQRCDTKKFTTHYESLNYCKDIGFNILEYMKLCNTTDEIIEKIKKIGSLRDSLAYDIDGAVIKVNDLKLRKLLGTTVKVPKWAIAFKYPPEQKQTKILDIKVQVGRTGQITPMAILEPVRLAGSIISKTTLHNFDYIKDKDIRVNDICIIQKAGDVIPEVIDIVKSKRDGSQKKYIVPIACPVCGEKLERLEGEVALRCTNSECPALLYRSLIHFTSRDCMDIEGLGEAMIDKLIDNGVLNDIADVYYIKPEDIRVLYKDADKVVTNIMNSIEKSKKNSLDKLIFGLGIRHIGKKAAITLSQNFSDIYELAKSDVEAINALDDFGEIMAESVVEFFNKTKTIELIDKFNKAGVNLNGQKLQKVSSKLEGMSFVITGSFENYTRLQIEDKIIKNSGKCMATVSKKTDYLIAGEDAGQKYDKAQKLNTKIITIQEFQNMIK